jgi:hypothetical protein
MDTIADDMLQRGDVDAALQLYATLALSSSTTVTQRRRRLRAARMHKTCTALSRVFTVAKLTPELRAAVCDAALDNAVPAAAFFGNAPNENATRRFQRLLLAVHPDKCGAANAADAAARLLARKEEFFTAHQPPLAEEVEAAPMPAPQPEHAQPATQPATPATPASPKRAASARHKRPGAFAPSRTLQSSMFKAPFASPVASPKARSLAKTVTPKSRTTPQHTELSSLMSTLRSAPSLNLTCNLSEECCSPTRPTPAPTFSSGTYTDEVPTDVQDAMFDTLSTVGGTGASKEALREALASVLRSTSPSSALPPADDKELPISSSFTVRVATRTTCAFPPL